MESALFAGISEFVASLPSFPPDDALAAFQKDPRFFQYFFPLFFHRSIVCPFPSLFSSSLQLDCFHFSPISVTVTCNVTTSPEFPPLFAPFAAVLRTALGLLGSLDAFSLHFPAVSLSLPSVPSTELCSRLSRHYLKSSLPQLYRLPGSFTLLGNPAGLLDSLQTGVRDFFSETLGPAGLEGLGRGARSLVLNATYGVCNSVGRIAGTLGDGVSSLTGSRAFQDGRIAGRAGIAFGLREGVSGVVTDVMTGAEEGGIFGALVGSGKGIAGLVLKPMAGALDEAAKQLEGMKEATQLKPKRPRVRLPRVSVGGEIAPFSEFLAEGRELLRLAIVAGNVPAGEEYVVHVPEATGHVIMISRGKWRMMTREGDVLWEEKTAGIIAATHELHVLYLRFHDSTVSIVCSSVETAHTLCLLLAAQQFPRDDWVAACVRFIAGEYGIPREEEDVRLLTRLEIEFQHPPMRLETPVDALPRDIRGEKVMAASIMESIIDVSSDSTVTIAVKGKGVSWKVIRGTGEFR